jgi:hypothetical protein
MAGASYDSPGRQLKHIVLAWTLEAQMQYEVQELAKFLNGHDARCVFSQ